MTPFDYTNSQNRTIVWTNFVKNQIHAQKY